MVKVNVQNLTLSEVLQEALKDTFSCLSADEGTLWVIDEEGEALVPRWNSGPNAAQILSRHRQRLTGGLISLVCATEQPLCENAVYRNTQQDPTLDRKLGVLTCAMIAVPLRLFGETVGVLSCVKLKNTLEAPDPEPFSAADLAWATGVVEELQSELEAEDDPLDLA
jgi:GAF domain-containing protein